MNGDVIRLKINTTVKDCTDAQVPRLSCYLFSRLLIGSAIAEQPHPAPKVGDLIHLDLIGDAARKYDRVNGGSFDNTNGNFPMLFDYSHGFDFDACAQRKR